MHVQCVWARCDGKLHQLPEPFLEDTLSGSSHLSTEDVPHFHHAALLGVQLGSLELETGTTHTYRNRSDSTWSWVILSAVGCLRPWSLVCQTRELRYKVSRPTSCTLYILLLPTHTRYVAQKCTAKLWTVDITASHHWCTKTQLRRVWVVVRDMVPTVYVWHTMQVIHSCSPLLLSGCYPVGPEKGNNNMISQDLVYQSALRPSYSCRLSQWSIGIGC